MDAINARTRLIQLEAERFLTQDTDLAQIPSYMADLTRRSRPRASSSDLGGARDRRARADLFGAQVG